MKKQALVLGAGGFIGNHMVNNLKKRGFWVRGVDLKYPEFNTTAADDFVIGDLRDIHTVSRVLYAPTMLTTQDKENAFDEVYQFAADMGGAGYIFTGENDANVMHNSSQINLNVCQIATKIHIKKILYSSSACMYPEDIQKDVNNLGLKESDAYPANPDSEYGWEKLFSERLFMAYRKNYGLNVRICRFHNIFGEFSTFTGGKEKAPSAVCRKVSEAQDGGSVEIWGDGLQTRSFLYIDECIEGVTRLMDSDFEKPLNIGSDEIISINDLCRMVIGISGKNLTINNVKGPVGVRGRNSDNTLIKETLNWSPTLPLSSGITKLYHWINSMKK